MSRLLSDYCAFFNHKNMKNKQDSVSLPYWILVVILGIATYKQIDFANLNFKNTGLGIVYLLTFIATIFLIVKKKKSNS